MANQYTSAEELGMPGKAERSRDAVRAEHLAQRIYKFIMGEADDQSGEKIEMDAVRMQACKILIDKGKPNLAAIEQTTIEDKLDTAELESRLEAIVRTQPEVLQRILGKIAAEQANPVQPVEQAA